MTRRSSSNLQRYGVILCAASLSLTIAEDKGVPTITWQEPPASSPASSVSCQADVTGSAIIGPANHLWVLVHRIDYDNVWVPQSEARIDPVTHNFKARVQFGERRDVGQDFEIALVTVSSTGHIALQNYRREAMISGNWKPIDMPQTTSPPIVRRVVKTGHDCN